jgi:predicted PurR-regulated permease PerM
MDQTMATIIISIIGVIGTVSAAIITARAQIAKSIKKLPSWQLLYENDEHGNKITGDINKLIDAIGSAYPIRVKVYTGKDEFQMFEAEWVFVQVQSVLAQNTSQISTLMDGKFISNP